MGASKSKADQAICAQASMPEPTPNKTVKVPIKKQAQDTNKSLAKEASLVADQVILPTKSWHALLAEQPMNPNAKPFCPGANPNAKPFCPGAATVPPTKLSPPCPPPSSKNAKNTEPTSPQKKVLVDKDDPEWMQYLSKKINDKVQDKVQEPIGSAIPAQKSSGRNGGGGKEAVMGRTNATGYDCRVTSRLLGNNGYSQNAGEAPNTSLVIQTESYLKLLREGSTKKKMPYTSMAAKQHAKKNSEEAEHQSMSAEPITASSLVKKWAGVGKKPFGVVENPTEEVAASTTVQDDIGIERLLVDMDLSEAAYDSDREELVVARTSASVHRLGRRPKMGKVRVRTYVMQDLSFELDQAVAMMLWRLQSFADQQRVLTTTRTEIFKNRRFVIGLKEVMRRTKQCSVDCLIIAPDIEEDANSGGLDDRMREMLALAYQNHTPVIFALSRARLGKALGKAIHISVLGVVDARGAQGLLKESVDLASKCRQAWLARLQT